MGTLAYQAIRKKSNSASYYPAYNIFGTVYVSTSRGLSSSTAIRYIAQGKSVWAKSKSLAKTACKKASPIGCAEWGQHGNTSNGYYPHYHAIKRYVGKNNYIHTGAHCWYYA